MLYNAALQERIDAYKKVGKSITLFDQMKSLTIIRSNDERYRAIPLSISRGTLQRLDEAFKGFFRRTKKGQKPGFPRFKKELKSIQFAEFKGIHLKGNQLCINGIAPIRVNLHRSISGDIKACIIKQDSCGDWWVCFKTKVKNKTTQPTGNRVGIDSGLKVLLATSDGVLIPNIRAKASMAKEMRRKQRLLARAKRGCKSRNRKRIQVARLHRKITDKRTTYLHQVSAKLVRENDLICAEKLNLRGLMKSNLAESLGDASIGRLHNMIAYKAEWAGKQFVQVDPKYTSQTCSCCGHRQQMPLSRRMYVCDECGMELDRDINAAINILHKGAVPLGAHKLAGSSELGTGCVQIKKLPLTTSCICVV